MYLNYLQFWIFMVGEVIYLDFSQREKRTWTKTERFQQNLKWNDVLPWLQGTPEKQRLRFAGHKLDLDPAVCGASL
jgi:hypothetical protein